MRLQFERGIYLSKKLDLLKEKEIKLLLKFMLPCVAGMVGLSVCILIDTIFIGRILGDLGLASLNISLPMYNIFNAIALTLGVGGATTFAICIGENNFKKVDEIFTSSIVGGIAICIFIFILSMLFIEPICYFFGASDNTFSMVKDYLSTLLFFNWAFIFIGILNVFVRCDKAPKLSMIAIIFSNLTNIILDYIFMVPLDMGMKGAALATSIAQMVGILILLLHFLRRNNTMKFIPKTFCFKTLKKLLRIGSPSFITELSSGFIIFIFNISIFNILGDIGVSAYGIITNIVLIFTAVFNGVSQGIQPLISVNYGANNHKRVRSFLKKATIISFTLGVIFLSIGLIAPEILVSLFSKDRGELLNITVQGINIYFFGLILVGVNIINIGYFQAIEKSKASLILSVLRGLVFVSTLIFILPSFLGIRGVWLTIPIAEILTLLSFFIIKKRVSKNINHSI